LSHTSSRDLVVKIVEHLEISKDDDLLKNPSRAIRKMTETAETNGKLECPESARQN